jgi:beta-glucosidase
MHTIRRSTVLGGCAALLASCARAPRPEPAPGDPPVARDFAVSIETPGGRRRMVRTDAREEAFVDSVLALMTLPEKLGQINQSAGRWGPGGVIVDTTEERRVRTREVGSPAAFVVEVGTSSDRVQGAEFELATADGQPVAVPERCEAA